jgi:hypothetical protein
MNRFAPVLSNELYDNNLPDQGASATPLLTYLQELRYTGKRSPAKVNLSYANPYRDCQFDIICDKRVQ